MKTYTENELKKIFENHKRWVEESEGWSEEDRADLREANLWGADLREADLWGADLRGADLREANLWGADLREADLWGADLWGADLRGANLRGANLRGADLRGANLRGANLRGANLGGARISDETKIRLYITCPNTGAFIAWKAVGKYIVKLEIPEDAKRSSATTRKCRADKARVLEIQKKDGSKAEVEECVSERGGVYKVGEMIYSDEWDECRWNECSHGIHFFVTRMEAEDWAD